MHEHANRLIYAADANFNDCSSIQGAIEKAQRILEETKQAFSGLNITLKGNTIFRLLEASAITSVAAEGIGIFADFKLFDVQSTIENDDSWLGLIPGIKILTVAESCHSQVFYNLEKNLPEVIIDPVGPLIDLTDEEFDRRGDGSRTEAVKAFFARVEELPATGVVCSPADLRLAPLDFANGREIITPAIRPLYTFVENDSNAVNALTPRKAILSGSTRLVVGSPIRHQNDLRGNALRILDEIGEALIERNSI